MNRTYSKTEKIQWILKYLIKELNPLIVGSHRFQYDAMYDGIRYPKILTYWNCHCTVEQLPDDIPYPFDDMFCLITKQFVTIIGDDIEYRFPVNLLVSIWERFTNTMEK